MERVCVIGGGISGLAAAFLLKKKGFEVTLFEKSERVGGNIESVRIDGFLIEYAPNSLLKSPRLVDLIRELELDTEVLAADEVNTKRYVLQNGKLKSLPMSVARIAANGFFSLKAKLRLLKEPFVRSKSPENESVAEFFERRLGREIVEKAADPFIAGIYAGKSENLSVKAAFPRLYELEKKYGSLLFGSLRSKTEKADKDFPRTFSFQNGVQTLTDKLAQNLGEYIKTNTEVTRIEKINDGKISVSTERRHLAGEMSECRQVEEIFDALIISTPAATAAKLIENLDSNLSKKFKSVYYPPVAMVFFGIKKKSIMQNLDGFGFLVPSFEKRKILGTIWNSSVFPNRAPDGYHLLTSFVGGSRNPDIFERSDEELFEIVYSELKDILGLSEIPSFRHIKRWPRAIPQYELGYDKIERAIEVFENAHRGIFFCSNFYKGISVGDCVKNSYAVGDAVSNFIKS
ncbi:MAG: protoporphyrinogen oxidase [Blastocatellia bacterium]|nr:protoporphyrinogen oxidase [Blastocatellia bacterium]